MAFKPVIGSYIIGGQGRLGRAIASEYADTKPNILDRSIYKNWSSAGGDDHVSRYFEKHIGDGSTVFVASGMLDPSAPPEDLLRINYTLPRNIIGAALKFGVKVITFGTVMEGLVHSQNPYIRSKIELNQYVEMVSGCHGLVKHIQLHTLYGVFPPSPFMFLGQMLFAIKENLLFRMTSGRQLREYHHLEDVSTAIRLIADSSVSGVINLSHGKPISLKEIAESVFDALGKRDLLLLGALPEPAEENYDQIFQADKLIAGLKFRETLTGINDHMAHCLSVCDKV